MFKYIIPILMVAVSSPALELNRLETGKSLLSETSDTSRARLFVDNKPVSDVTLRPFRKDAKMELAVTAISPDTIQITVPAGSQLPFSGGMSAALDFEPGASQELTASFGIKFENFQLGKGCANNFFFILGGVHLQFRGDTRDVRYFDGTQGKFVILQKLKENEWYELAIVLNPETFNVNNQKGIKLRSPGQPKLIQWNSQLTQSIDTKNPIIQLKDIKVK